MPNGQWQAAGGGKRDVDHAAPVDEVAVNQQKRDAADLMADLDIQVDNKKFQGGENKKILNRKKRSTDQSVEKIVVMKKQIPSDGIKPKEAASNTKRDRHSDKAVEIQTEKNSNMKTQPKSKEAAETVVKDGEKKLNLDLKRKLKSVEAGTWLAQDGEASESRLKKIKSDQLSYHMAAIQMSRRR